MEFDHTYLYHFLLPFCDRIFKGHGPLLGPTWPQLGPHLGANLGPTWGPSGLQVGFQVAGVKKPFVSVKRIAEQGNYVQFGPRDQDNFIAHRSSIDKIQYKPNGRGSYLMVVDLVGGGREEMTVDSGAEENVCPRNWGSQYGMENSLKKLKLRGAGGNFIEHYGQRNVVVTSPF